MDILQQNPLLSLSLFSIVSFIITTTIIIIYMISLYYDRDTFRGVLIVNCCINRKIPYRRLKSCVGNSIFIVQNYYL